MNDHEVQNLQNEYTEVLPHSSWADAECSQDFQALRPKKKENPKLCFHFLFLSSVLPSSHLPLFP